MDHTIYIWLGLLLIAVIGTAFISGGLGFYTGYKHGVRDGEMRNSYKGGEQLNSTRLRRDIKAHTARMDVDDD